jgi:hypothetical protein
MVFIKLLCQEVWVGLFKNWKHIERCLQTISTQSYYEPIQYDLDGKEDYCIGENYCYLFPDMSSIKSYSNIPHNRKVNTYYLIRILHIQ